MRVRPLLVLPIVALVAAIGCSNAEEGGLSDRGDALESEPYETGAPDAAASLSGGGTGGSAASEGVAATIGQTGHVFPPSAQPTGHSPRRTYGFVTVPHPYPHQGEGMEHGPAATGH